MGAALRTVRLGGDRGRAALVRTRDNALPVARCALAASVAWAFASYVLGHAQPFFACVAAVVCLGLRAGERLRRTGELAVGVTVGVAVGDLLVSWIGSGVWQIGLVVGVAMLLAVAVDGGPLLVTQSGLQAVFVVALPRTPGGDLARWEDALVGGATALLVAALLPPDPWRDASRHAQRCLDDLAGAVRSCAHALRDGDPVEAAEALARARGTQAGLDAWAQALQTGQEVTRLSPLRRDRGGTGPAQALLQSGVDRATRNMRVLVRRVLFALETGDRLPDRLPEELDRFAAAVDELRTSAGPPEALLQLAAELDPDALHAEGLSGSVVVAQLRAAVVDLLVGEGVPVERARSALPPLHHEPEA